MVRKWSYVTSSSSERAGSFKFTKRYKIRTFRSVVSYKKFTFKVTKLRRKALIRFKHKANWALYANVFKSWVSDFIFTKHYARSQFFRGALPGNFVLYNFNFIRDRSEEVALNYDFILSTWSRRSRSYYLPVNTSALKFSSYTVANFTDYPASDSTLVPVYSAYEGGLYAVDSLNELNELLDAFFVPASVSTSSYTEMFKSLLVLFFFSLKFKNVK